LRLLVLSAKVFRSKPFGKELTKVFPIAAALAQANASLKIGQIVGLARCE